MAVLTTGPDRATHGAPDLVLDAGGVPTETEAALTPRERQIWALLAQAATHREMERDLGLSKQTLNWYVRELRRKMGVQSALELVVLWHGGTLYRDAAATRGTGGGFWRGAAVGPSGPSRADDNEG